MVVHPHTDAELVLELAGSAHVPQTMDELELELELELAGSAHVPQTVDELELELELELAGSAQVPQVTLELALELVGSTQVPQAVLELLELEAVEVGSTHTPHMPELVVVEELPELVLVPVAFWLAVQSAPTVLAEV